MKAEEALDLSSQYTIDKDVQLFKGRLLDLIKIAAEKGKRSILFEVPFEETTPTPEVMIMDRYWGPFPMRWGGRSKEYNEHWDSWKAAKEKLTAEMKTLGYIFLEDYICWPNEEESSLLLRLTTERETYNQLCTERDAQEDLQQEKYNTTRQTWKEVSTFVDSSSWRKKKDKRSVEEIAAKSPEGKALLTKHEEAVSLYDQQKEKTSLAKKLATDSWEAKQALWKEIERTLLGRSSRY